MKRKCNRKYIYFISNINCDIFFMKDNLRSRRNVMGAFGGFFFSKEEAEGAVIEIKAILGRRSLMEKR